MVADLRGGGEGLVAVVADLRGGGEVSSCGSRPKGGGRRG